jgi:CMP-N-acetylneuraminic acid synthetase
MRPVELADDLTGTHAVMSHALAWCRDNLGPVEFGCCIYATAPFLRAADLRESLERLRRSGRDFLFSVTTFEFPVQRALYLEADGSPRPLYPENIWKRSQDLGEAVHDAGQFYWGRPQAFDERAIMYSERSLAYALPRHCVQDIDTPEDWTRAELMYTASRTLSAGGAEDAP